MFSRLLVNKNNPSVNMHEQVYFVFLLYDVGFFLLTQDIQYLFQDPSPTLALTKHLIIPFNSDTIYLVLVSDPRSWSFQSHKIVPTSDTNHKSRANCISDWPAIDWKFLVPRFSRWLPEFRKALYLCLSVYCKEYKWRARWRGTKNRIWMSSKCRSFCPYRVGAH